MWSGGFLLCKQSLAGPSILSLVKGIVAVTVATLPLGPDVGIIGHDRTVARCALIAIQQSKIPLQHLLHAICILTSDANGLVLCIGSQFLPVQSPERLAFRVLASVRHQFSIKVSLWVAMRCWALEVLIEEVLGNAHAVGPSCGFDYVSTEFANLGHHLREGTGVELKQFVHVGETG